MPIGHHDRMVIMEGSYGMGRHLTVIIAATSLSSSVVALEREPAQPVYARAPIPRPPRHFPKHQSMARKARRG